MFTKSFEVEHYQRKMVACLKDGDRRNARWFMKNAASQRQRDMARASRRSDYVECGQDPRLARPWH